MLYDDFKPVVDLVLNNWTALQLAVEHGMGAPGGKETAQLMSVYVTRYCVENIVENYELQEVIEDLMDEEFETACHDDSPKEIANLLIQCLNLLKEGRHSEVNVLLEALPKCQMWLSKPAVQQGPPQSHGNPDDDTTSSSSDGEDDDQMLPETANCNEPPPPETLNEDEAMEQEEDSGWTTVKTRRKK